MNRRQKRVVLLGVSTAVSMLTFPPFIWTEGSRIHNLGFAFILTPPVYYRSVGSVNVPLLSLELLACAAIVAVLVYFFKD